MSWSRHSQFFDFLKTLEILPEWDRAAGRFLDQGGTVMALAGGRLAALDSIASGSRG